MKIYAAAKKDPNGEGIIFIRSDSIPALSEELGELPSDGVGLGTVAANYSDSLQQQIYDEVRDAMNASGIIDQ